MLEAARILAKAGDPLNIRVIGFTLEEGPPERRRKKMVAAQELDLMDENYNYRSLNTQRLWKKFSEYVRQGRRTGRENKVSVKMFMDEFKDHMNERELLYFEGLGEFYEEITHGGGSWIGKRSLVGSSHWVEEKSQDIDIAGVINLDTVGYISQKPHSQSFPAGMNPDMLSTHLVEDPYVGNYLVGIGDLHSGPLLDLFTNCSKMEGVGLPFAGLHVPFGFDTINEKMVDLLRSDHTPFWREGIPALMLTDTGNFRYPYYHTRADTIDKLDFEFIVKVCKASIATAIGSTSLK